MSEKVRLFDQGVGVGVIPPQIYRYNGNGENQTQDNMSIDSSLSLNANESDSESGSGDINKDKLQILEIHKPHPETQTEEKATNTDDIIKLIPYEVDHWASRCIRFADEFQSSHSLEDAQSALLDLEESLDHYLTLSNFDGDLRVDVLLYCILSNVLEGLELQSTSGRGLFPPPDVVSSLVAKTLSASGQLGRYGFQSLKQGLKTLKFLMDFYKTVEPQKRPKCPIILWQSVKKIGVQGSTLFPALFPGDQDQWLRFHGDSCPPACCKSVRVDFSGKGNPIILQHALSTERFLESLQLILQNEEFFFNPENPIVLTPLSSTSKGKLEDLSIHPMISCDIDILRSNSNLICDIIRSQPQYQKALDNCRRNRRGSVILRWTSRHFTPQENQQNQNPSQAQAQPGLEYFILGMKQFGSEHLQTLLVDQDQIDVNENENVSLDDECDRDRARDPDDSLSFHDGSLSSIDVDDEGDMTMRMRKRGKSTSGGPGGRRGPGWLIVDTTGKKVTPAGRIPHIGDLQWDLKFGSCPQGCWTRGEILFLNKLQVFPFLEECSVTFEDHLCSGSGSGVKCPDCMLQEDLESHLKELELRVDKLWTNGQVELGVKVEFKGQGQNQPPKTGTGTVSRARDDGTGVAKGRDFARWKFAMSLHPLKREVLRSLHGEFMQRFGGKRGFFEDEDFEQILRIWEQNKEYYYARWRTQMSTSTSTGNS